ncbi:MAG: Modulator of FtsH protease HflC [Candidatus Omnitrophica bacterium ADurb.Bin277]|nr:MAG: Modulator of FtsH protease HflC [Candidatus Omnitrophica bacterium ADurb.Bin277]
MNAAMFLRFWPIVILSAVFLFPSTVFIVDETNQVIVTRLGEYKRTLQKPGLKLKIPVFERAHFFEKRILTSGALPAEYLTLDKKRLVADHVTRWKITDPLMFYKTVRDLAGAKARLDDIVFSEMRRELASHDFSKIIASERENIMDTIAGNARKQAEKFGIELVDVRIKRADLPQEVQESVFARMKAERQRIAKRYRSEGEEEAFKIRGETDKNRTIIMAKAYEESQELRGEGDAVATRVYAEAYGQDADFYTFVRSLEAYEKGFQDKTTFLFSPDSDVLRHLKNNYGNKN